MWVIQILPDESQVKVLMESLRLYLDLHPDDVSAWHLMAIITEKMLAKKG